MSNNWENLGDFLSEEVSFPPKAKKEVELFLGRMQPLHKGHLEKIIKKMKNPVIAIVKGEKSSADKAKNPFSFEQQEAWLKKAAPHVKVIKVPSGYVPDIIAKLRETGLETSVVWAGLDRATGYISQLERVNKTLEGESLIGAVVKVIPRDEDSVSATKVRAAINSDDIESFKKLMPKELWDEFESMKNTLSEDVTATTTTANVSLPPAVKKKKTDEVDEGLFSNALSKIGKGIKHAAIHSYLHSDMGKGNNPLNRKIHKMVKEGSLDEMLTRIDELRGNERSSYSANLGMQHHSLQSTSGVHKTAAPNFQHHGTTSVNGKKTTFHVKNEHGHVVSSHPTIQHAIAAVRKNPNHQIIRHVTEGANETFEEMDIANWQSLTTALTEMLDNKSIGNMLAEKFNNLQ